jgi:proline iminopeptidase
MAERRVRTDDGASLWVDVAGTGTPMILCHGGPGLWDYFDDLAADIEDLVTVVRWEQRGCGRSTDGEYSHSVERYVEDLETIRLEVGVDRWVVGGHSWGAMLALQYALQHPDRTCALVYISGVGIGQEWRHEFRAERGRRLGDEYDRWLTLSDGARTPEEEAEYRRMSWGIDFVDQAHGAMLAARIDRPFAINTEANRLIGEEMNAWIEEDLVFRCAQLKTPALVIHGAEDPRSAWAIDSLVAALSNGEVAVLSGAGHFPWLDARQRFSDSLRAFHTRVTRT